MEVPNWTFRELYFISRSWRDMTSASKLKPKLAGFCVFLLVLCTSACMAVLVYRQNLAAAQVEFEARADSLAAQISRELEITIAVIKAGASAIRLSGATEGDILKDRLYAFLEAGDVMASSPSILNVGLVLNSAFDQITPGPPSFPLIAVYPAINSPIIGTDLSFSAERMAAIELARDTGQAGVGDRIELLSGSPGVFFAYPVYASGDALTSIDERRKQTIGIVVAVLETDSFMVNALNEIDLREVDFEVHNLGASPAASKTLGTATILASSRLEKVADMDLASNELLATNLPEAIFRDVSVGGQVWRILLAPKQSDSRFTDSFRASVVGLVGLCIALLAAFATYQQLSQAALLKQRVDTRTRDLQAANSRILKQANEDALTGLGNRRALSDAIMEMTEQNELSPGQSIAAIHIDLDRFKQINDTMGHAGGDFILCHVANLIRSLFPAEAFCARVGGDEFTVAMVVDAIDLEGLVDAAHRLVNACLQPIDFEGRACRFGASVGIATQPLGELDPSALLINADLALYRAKAEGRGHVKLFSPDLHEKLIAYKTRADDILRAIEAGGEIIPYFQPQICGKTGRLFGVEALARWNHPTLGILPPSEFLRVAEDLDVVAQIDRLILENAIHAINRVNEAGHNVPRLSTNLSFSRLMEADFMSSISNLPPCKSALGFEILESVFLDDESGPALWNIDAIREAGMEVEIDDFGSGRASVVALTRVAPNRMKIDRELVAPIVEHEERLHLVRSIVEIGKVLGIAVAAEGVETMEQARLLTEMGCDVLQGYLFAAPLSEEALLTYLQSQRTITLSA